MRSIAERRAWLRRRIAEGPILVAPGAGDALGARLIERAGFEAVYMSGYCVEATYGQADIGLLGMSQMADRAQQMVDATDLPLIADADTGYGNAINVMKTIRAYEKAGVAGLHFEDQELPKKCGSFSGKRIVKPEEMIGKIKAAVDARTDPDLHIIARSDAFPIEGFDATVERLCRYGEAGADLFMLHGALSEEQVAGLPARLNRPFIYMNGERPQIANLHPRKLDQYGVRVVLYPLSVLMAAAWGMQQVLERIKRDGTTVDAVGKSILPANEFDEIVGLSGIIAAESRYAS